MVSPLIRGVCQIREAKQRTTSPKHKTLEEKRNSIICLTKVKMERTNEEEEVRENTQTKHKKR